ncbi:MAG: cytidylate kinase family protein [Terriglobales bacterium]
MALILISRGSFSGCQVIAECLGKSAGVKAVTREDLIASVNRQGEIANKVTASIAKATQNYAEFSALRRPYQILMRLALLEYARAGPIAYFGYSGHLLLPEIDHAVRVRIIAPVYLRVKLMMSKEKLTEQEARDRIREYDEDRARWTRFMYGKTLRDPEQFDLCINLDRVSFSTACCMIQRLGEESDFKTTPESMAVVENHYLATLVMAALLTDGRTFELEIGVTAQNGHVSLEGPYLEPSEQATVLEIAGAIPGVIDAQYVEGYAPPFGVLSLEAAGGHHE